MKKYRSAMYAAVALLILGILVAGYYLVGAITGTRLAQQGYQASALGDYETAIARYEAALRKPLSRYQKSYVYLNRGAAYNFKWRFDEAIRDHTEALQLNPTLIDAYAGRGFAYLRKGENEKGITDLTEAIRLDPNSPSAYYNRGLIFLQKGEPDKALADLEEAVRCNPNSAAALVGRGLCYVARNDLDRALASFDGAVALEPTNPIGYLHRSHLYARKGERDKEERDYEQARRLNPSADPLSRQFSESLNEGLWTSWSRRLATRKSEKDAHRLYEEVQLAYDLGKYDRAIELNGELLALSSTSAQASIARMNRGNAYAAKGDTERALHDYNEAINLDAKNTGAYVDRALLFARSGKQQEALQDYDTAIRLNPQQWQAYFNRAIELAKEGQLTRAIADLTNTIKLNPKFIGAYINRAGLFLQRDELEKAIADCNSAMQLDPNASEPYWIRANVYKLKGDSAKTLADLETAVRLKPKKLEVALNSLAWLRATCPEATLRDGKKAVELATKACELSLWKKASFIDTLAAAYAEVGDFDEAIKHQTRVLSIGGLPDNARSGVQKRLELYKQHKPYREG
jgi:tetratricopeptide (TPR) repeat protein